MHSRNLLLLLCLYLSIVNADNSVGAAGVGLSESSKTVSTNKYVNVTYSMYNYKFTAEKFTKLLVNNSIRIKQPLLQKNEIMYSALIDKSHMSEIANNFSKVISNLNSGSTICPINNEECTFSNTNTENNSYLTNKITFTPHYNAGKVVVQVNTVSNNEASNSSQVKGQISKVQLNNVLGKNYILISGHNESEYITGQILIVSFSK